ncbi:MAG: pyruvate formate-lyase 1-activating enzyme, partial [Clostridium sp.]|nr:pyruvate formate-lyase 1-activating enzyme [Clostridium sp.]
IHTCLDTSGITYNAAKDEEFQELFKYTDLVMLDIKTSDRVLHQELTKQSFDPVEQFAFATGRANVPLRIRHVIVPGYTFDEDKLFHLGQMIGKLGNLKELEVLPYHSMGVVKYENLGMEYPLKGMKDLDKEDSMKARQIILKGVADVKRK